VVVMDGSLRDHVLVIDNYDSFTFNLVQHLRELGACVTVLRNDSCTVGEIAAAAPAAIVMSPGPKRPEDAGVCVELVQTLGAHVPMLGVCLGHQAIGLAYGARIDRAPSVVHGKVWPVSHDGAGVLRGLDNPFMATRYHSLVVERDSVPAELDITAWSDDGLVMAMQHREHPVHGVQFHPESIGTPLGRRLLGNFLETAKVQVSALP
jgi:anthranilate synthase component II